MILRQRIFRGVTQQRYSEEKDPDIGLTIAGKLDTFKNSVAGFDLKVKKKEA